MICSLTARLLPSTTRTPRTAPLPKWSTLPSAKSCPISRWAQLLNYILVIDYGVTVDDSVMTWHPKVEHKSLVAKKYFSSRKVITPQCWIAIPQWIGYSLWFYWLALRKVFWRVVGSEKACPQSAQSGYQSPIYRKFCSHPFIIQSHCYAVTKLVFNLTIRDFDHLFFVHCSWEVFINCVHLLPERKSLLARR